MFVVVVMVVFVFWFKPRVASESLMSIFFHLEASKTNTMRSVVPELVVLLYAIRVDISR